jgi:hypothetical protein
MEKTIANLSLVKPLRNQGFFAVVDHLTKTPGINQGTVERLPHHGNPSYQRKPVYADHKEL